MGRYDCKVCQGISSEDYYLNFVDFRTIEDIFSYLDSKDNDYMRQSGISIVKVVYKDG